MSAKRGQSFGEQAARFSLYAPFAAIVIGLIANSSGDQPSVKITLAWLNVLLVMAGLCLGIVALASMRRYGKQRILGRAIVGVVFNGLIIAAIIALLLPLMLAANLKKQLAGRWLLQTGPNQMSGTITMTLKEDRSFALESSRDGITTASLSGSWGLTVKRVLGVNVEHVEQGNQSAAGKQLGLGIVKSLDDKQLILQTDKGQEIYTRVR